MCMFIPHLFMNFSGLNAFAHTELQDLNNFDSDPEEFARTFCKDLGIEDPEAGVSNI